MKPQGSILCCALCALGDGFLGSSLARSAGFELPETSIAGLGMANALTANPEIGGAFAYNHAAMGFHQRSSLSMGVLAIGPRFQVTTGSGSHADQGARWTLAPQVFAALAVSAQWRIGIGIQAPFGAESRWHDGTFLTLSGYRTLDVPPSWEARVPLGHPTSSKLAVVATVPSVAYRLHDHLSIAAGLDYYWIKTARLDSTAHHLRGSGQTLGINLGALYRNGDWSLGAAWHSGATATLSGRYRPLSTTLVALGHLAPRQMAQVDLDLPWRLRLGIRRVLDERWALEFDWSYTGWNGFERIEVRGRESSAPLFYDRHDWSDSAAYRLGATYEANERMQLRLGYSYDATGQGSAHFSPRIPDTNRHLFSVGVSYQLTPATSLEAGYLYVHGEPRSHRGQQGTQCGTAHCAEVFAGDYRMTAHLVGLGLHWTF